MQKIIECVPNFSEGRRTGVIKKIAASAKKIPGIKVLDVEWNPSHNRSLVTIIGPPQNVIRAAYAMIKTATDLIDMNTHRGEHPRIGATDVVPLVPVSGISVMECVLLARKLGESVSRELKIPVYFYEEAATGPKRVNLADIRAGEYEGLKNSIITDPSRKPDKGPSKLHITAGATVIGVRKFLIAYNVNLQTDDVTVAKKIASVVREKNGGLPKVKALGFLVNGYAQVSMNLTDFEKTNIDQAFMAVEKAAKKLKVGIINSQIYGMIPLAALVKFTKDALKADTFTIEQVLEKKMFILK